MSKGAYIGVTPPTYGELAVGSTVKLNVGGVATNFLVVHQGNPDSAQYDASCNGTWLLMENTYTSMAWNNGGNDYGNSDVHEYLNGEFLALFDSDIQALIKQVKIPYRNGTGTTSGGTNDYGENGLSTKAFLLSVRELGWTASDVSKATPEGAALSYFAPNQNALRVAYKSGSTSASLWATRTPVTGASTSVNRVYTNGSNDSIAVKNSSGIRPAIIMPSNSSSANGAIARKVKKGYIGIEGLARKIKKAYIGIGGVARPCWGNGELEYYGTITPLSAARTSLAATTIGKYALFGGGEDSAGESAVVDAYNTSLVRSTPTGFSGGDKYVKATTVGSYAMFGGRRGVKAYNASLTTTTKDGGEMICYAGGSAASVGNYALFAYGHTTSTMKAYDSSLTKRTPTSLSYSAYYRGAASVGNYALFGGGMRTSAGNVACQSSVNAYDSSLTRSSATALSKSRYSLATTTIGNYALFAGGNITTTTSSNTSTDIVDVYDDSLTRSTMSLSVAKRNLAATTVGGFALVGGGLDAANGAVVDVFDINLTRITTTPLSGYRSLLAATSVGDYALFGGGKTDAFSAVVDAYST